jgi:hypothetical protein
LRTLMDERKFRNDVERIERWHSPSIVLVAFDSFDSIGVVKVKAFLRELCTGLMPFDRRQRRASRGGRRQRCAAGCVSGQPRATTGYRGRRRTHGVGRSFCCIQP